jgi:hypothetical protein
MYTITCNGTHYGAYKDKDTAMRALAMALAPRPKNAYNFGLYNDGKLVVEARSEIRGQKGSTR